MDVAELGQVEIAKLLLEHGADVNARNGVANFTPLIGASHEGHLEMVKLLLDHGADIHAVDEQGRSALTESRRHRNQAIEPYLREHGAKD